MKSVNILGLNNNFYGSYSSNQVFFEELMHAFVAIGVNVKCANSLESAKSILDKGNIDFTIGFSKYFYIENGVPLYDKYGVINYQWVSDNPLKMNLDCYSSSIKYIFIDKEYPLIIPKLENKPLFIPLGYRKNTILKFLQMQRGVVLPAKIRNLNEIYRTIRDSSYSKLALGFLERYSLDASFIADIVAYFKDMNIHNPEAKEAIFRMTNEYARVLKRLSVLGSIRDRDVYVFGEDYGNILPNKCKIHFLSPVKYADLKKVLHRYRYVINVDPNYHMSVHDRFIKAVAAGTVCVTNENGIFKNDQSFVYKFSALDALDDILDKLDSSAEDVALKECKIIEKFSWENAALAIVDNYKNDRMIDFYEISN